MSNVVLYGTAADNKKYAIKCTASGELAIESGYTPLSATIHTGTLAPLAFSAAITLNNLYKNSLLTYYDTTARTLTRPLTIWGSTTTNDTAEYRIIGTIVPTALDLGVDTPPVIELFARFSTQTIELGAFKFIKIHNEYQNTSLVGVAAYLYGA